ALTATREPWLPLDAGSDPGETLHRLCTDARVRRRFRTLAARADATAENFRDLIRRTAAGPGTTAGPRGPQGASAPDHGKVEDVHRVSLYYDDDGNEIGRDTGLGVGRLWRP